MDQRGHSERLHTEIRWMEHFPMHSGRSNWLQELPDASTFQTRHRLRRSVLPVLPCTELLVGSIRETS